jgi:hypothetical protein
MEQVEQTWGFSPGEKAALVAAARAWPGTQREFAAEHGISQATVSKWLSADLTRRCEQCGQPMAGRRPHARFCTDGCRAKASKVRDREDVHGDGSAAAPVPVHTHPTRPAPTMLEVVWTPAAPRAPAPTPEPLRTGVRLMLGDGVGMVFDTLPPASWVAQFAAELRRC